MKRSTDRILTTHVGSLSRPDSLVSVLTAKDRGQPFDREAYNRLVREAVADVVRRQTDAGVDVVTDGEQGKASFFGYVVERFTGFERQPAPTGQDGSTRAASREYLDFPEYYAWSDRIAEGLGGRGNTRRYGVDVCTGPVTYRGQAAVREDIATLKAALQGRPHEEVFLPAIAPPTSSPRSRTASTGRTRSTSRRWPTRSTRSTRRSSTRASSSRSTTRGS